MFSLGLCLHSQWKQWLRKAFVSPQLADLTVTSPNAYFWIESIVEFLQNNRIITLNTTYTHLYQVTGKDWASSAYGTTVERLYKLTSKAVHITNVPSHLSLTVRTTPCSLGESFGLWLFYKKKKKKKVSFIYRRLISEESQCFRSRFYYSVRIYTSLTYKLKAILLFD